MDQKLHEMARAAMPFAEALDLTVEEGGPDRVVVSAAWAPERCTAGGVLHGGYLMAAADSTAAVCAHLNRPAGSEGTTTLESKTNFVGAVTGGIVRWTAEPVHVGRSTIVVQTDARDEAGALISRSLQTQAVLHGTP